MPAMMFVGNLNYVAIAVVGGLRVASGAMRLGDVQAFIQYSRQFTQPLTQLASMANLLQSGVASAERVFELLDAEEQSPDPVPAAGADARRAGGSSSSDVSFRYKPDEPLIEDLSLVAEPGQTVAIVGPTGAGKTTLVNLIMRFYELDGGRILLDGVDIAAMRRADLRSRRSAWCCRTPGCSAARSATTSATADPTRPRRRSSRPRKATLRRPVRARAARRLRHRDRRRGRQRQRRREAADHDRARVPRRAVAPDPRRGDLLGRHPHRGARAARDGGAARGPHELRDRAPAVDDPRRRPHPRDGARRDRRAGHARRAARRRTARTGGSTTRSSRRRSPTSTATRWRAGRAARARCRRRRGADSGRAAERVAGDLDAELLPGRDLLGPRHRALQEAAGLDVAHDQRAAPDQAVGADRDVVADRRVDAEEARARRCRRSRR